MNSTSVNLRQENIHEVMKVLNNMPLPESLNNWEQVYLLEVEDQDNTSYELRIQGGKWEVIKGKTHEPHTIITGTESYILKFLFGDVSIDAKNMKRGPIKGSFKDALISQKMWSAIFNYLQEIVTIQEQQADPLLAKKANYDILWSKIFKSINKTGHWARKDISVIGEVIEQIAAEKNSWSLTAMGFAGVDFPRKIREQINEMAIQLTKEHFDKLISEGSISTPDLFLINYHSEPTRADFLSINILVAFYAVHIAEMKKVNLNKENIELAYDFFLQDLKRYLKEKFHFTPLEDEEIKDWHLIDNAGVRILFISNHRIALTPIQNVGSIINESIRLLDGESHPIKVNQVDNTIILQTSLRLIWLWPFQTAFSNGFKLYHDQLELGESIKHSIHLVKSSLFLALSENLIYYWKEGGKLMKIPLKDIAKFEVKVEETVKKILFLTQKSNQSQLVFHSSEKISIDINENDQDVVLEFLEQTKF